MAASVVDVPAVGLYRTPKHEYYFNGDGPYPGVTGVLGIIDKPALVEWAKRETAECAVRNWDVLDVMRAQGGDAAAIDWLKRIPDYVRDTAANRGTRVHAAADAYARHEPIDLAPEEIPALEAYRYFLEERNVRIVAAELAVIGSVPGMGRYGGTGDLWAQLDDTPETWMLDIKTSKGTYKETALQLAAYAYGDFGAYPGDPQAYRLPPADRFGVVHIRPDLYPDTGYRLVEYDVTPDTFGAFCAAYRLAAWLRGPSPIRKEPK